MHRFSPARACVSGSGTMPAALPVLIAPLPTHVPYEGGRPPARRVRQAVNFVRGTMKARQDVHELSKARKRAS
jgi:hypothetical protein